MISALKVAVEVVNQVEGYANYEQMEDGFEKIPALIEKAASQVTVQAKKFAEQYADASQVYVLGSGATAEVAYATSLCLFHGDAMDQLSECPLRRILPRSIGNH